MSEIPKDETRKNYLERLKPGSFLIASDELTDPNFQATIALICQHSDEGSYALVLNRTAHMPLSEIFNSIEKERDSLIEVHLGGPVQESQLQLLHLTSLPVADAIEVSPGVYMGGVWNKVDDIIKPNSGEFLLFLGYSGWGEGQLEYEINLGGWEVYEIDAAQVLSAKNETAQMGVEAFKSKFIKSL